MSELKREDASLRFFFFNPVNAVKIGSYMSYFHLFFRYQKVIFVKDMVYPNFLRAKELSRNVYFICLIKTDFKGLCL